MRPTVVGSTGVGDSSVRRSLAHCPPGLLLFTYSMAFVWSLGIEYTYHVSSKSRLKSSTPVADMDLVSIGLIDPVSVAVLTENPSIAQIDYLPAPNERGCR